MTPKVGDQIYIPTSLYLSHGRDDFQGGLCTVHKVFMAVSAGKSVPFVTVEERPFTQYNWISLGAEQNKLKELYNDKRGHSDPDDRPEFNTP